MRLGLLKHEQLRQRLYRRSERVAATHALELRRARAAAQWRTDAALQRVVTSCATIADMDRKKRLQQELGAAERELDAAKKPSQIRAAPMRRVALQGLRWLDEEEVLAATEKAACLRAIRQFKVSSEDQQEFVRAPGEGLAVRRGFHAAAISQ
jgi:hypothetical protein